MHIEGLTHEEAARRLSKYGLNKLPAAKSDSVWIIFLRQFASPLIYLLFIAAAVVFLIGQRVDSLIIIFVLLFNAVVGTVQEGKAQNTLLALKKFASTYASVLRGERETIINDEELVPGDLLVLREGEKVGADAEMVQTVNLKVDEASLTGESESVLKKVGDKIYKGTHVVSGSGKATVQATGSLTRIGKLAKQISTIDDELPLKENIKYLSRLIIWVVALISAVLFIVGISVGEDARQMFGIVVSLAVSVIPEGLPIVMTLVLATGVWRMSKHNVLVKKLQAVEALGQTRLFAVDKTGTVTKNEMVIQKVWIDNRTYNIGGVGYEPKGAVHLDGRAVDPTQHMSLLFAGKAAALSSGARLSQNVTGEFTVAGDPTEAAMLVFARKLGLHRRELFKETPLIEEMPFDYKAQYKASLYREGESDLLVVVGAPEKILSLSNKIHIEGGSRALNVGDKGRAEEMMRSFSEEGLRVLAFAIKKNVKRLGGSAVGKLSFVGLFAMRDALKQEVKEVLAQASQAGIKIVMITGDHEVTARAIAREAGIFKEGDKVISGRLIDGMSEEQLALELPKVSVFARVNPEHKLKIIQAYKKIGQTVSMTGDGVNDAPSLVAADLGIAMGRIGTEVAKEASDIVLLDDNFKNVILAIEEGRNIYKTIKKVILYLFSTSAGEVLAIAGAIIVGLPVPILAAQVIWLNFVTDGFLDVALAMEPKEKNLLLGKFKKPAKYIVDRLMGQRIVIMAVPMALGTIFLFSRYYEADITKAWTITLTLLAVFQWFNAWNCRSENKSIFHMNFFSNKYLIGATGIVILLQLIALYTPFGHEVLHTTSIALVEWLIIIPLAFSIIVIEEVRKYFTR